MQDRYVGDIGDFGKYGLLKALCLHCDASRRPELSLGVVWYLVPDETHNGDGKLTRYLDRTSRNLALYPDCDPTLYDALSEMVFGSERHVRAVRLKGVLPSSTVFHETPLSFEGMTRRGAFARSARVAHRRSWVQHAVEAVKRCDVIFIDPDNGLEVPSRARHHRRGPKYCFLEELLLYSGTGQSIVIYQHIDRRSAAEDQIKERLSQVNERLRHCGGSFAMLYHRGSSRAYLIVPSQAHRELLMERAQSFIRGCWGRHRHFTLVPSTP